MPRDAQGRFSLVPSYLAVDGQFITTANHNPVLEDIAKYLDKPVVSDGEVTPPKLSTGGPFWNTAGNVGIGTTTPNQKLEVNGFVLSPRYYVDANSFFSADVGGQPGINFDPGTFFRYDRASKTYQFYFSTGQNVTINSTGFVGDGSQLTNIVVPDGSIGTTKIPDNAVTGPKIAANAVTGPKIADGAVTAAKIPTGAIPPDRLSTGGPGWDAAGNLTVAGQVNASTWFSFGNQWGLRRGGTQMALDYGANNYMTYTNDGANSSLQLFMGGYGRRFTITPDVFFSDGPVVAPYHGFPYVPQYGMQLLENNTRLHFDFGGNHYMLLKNSVTLPSMQVYMGAFGRTFAVDKNGVIANLSQSTGYNVGRDIAAMAWDAIGAYIRSTCKTTVGNIAPGAVISGDNLINRLLGSATTVPVSGSWMYCSSADITSAFIGIFKRVG